MSAFATTSLRVEPDTRYEPVRLNGNRAVVEVEFVVSISGTPESLRRLAVAVEQAIALVEGGDQS